MRSFREEELADALSACRIDRGDVVFVHSSLIGLGRLHSAAIDEIPRRVLAVLRDRLGDAGTIVVPTFNFEFCRGERFDRQNTPSQAMGALSEFVRQHRASVRSPHPMQSISALGPAAGDLASRDTPGAFEEGSSFDALLDLDAQILLLGCGINAVSLVHWAEEKVGVPYRYFKSFSGPYRDGDRIERRTYRMYVRDLQWDPEVRVEPVGAILRRRGELRRIAVGQSVIESCRGRDFVGAAVQLLRRNPRALIDAPPTPSLRSRHAAR